MFEIQVFSIFMSNYKFFVMKYSFFKLGLIVSIFFISNPILSHEGHGQHKNSLLHYFYSIEHLVLIAIPIIAIALLVVRKLISEKAN